MALAGYTYRKSITLSRASGAVTNYQMRLLVGESSGATGEDVDCGGLCLSTFNDLRFTTSDGETLLDYWIESISGTSPNQLATIWVEFNSIQTSATTFYMYYGNVGAVSASNGVNTFISFDDFEASSVDPKWTTAGDVSISTSQKWGGDKSLKCYGVSGYARINVTPSDNIAISFRVYKDAGATVDFFNIGDGTKRTNFIATEDLYSYDGATWTKRGTMSASSWTKFEARDFNFSAGTYSIYKNDALLTSTIGMWTTSTYNGRLVIGTGSTSSATQSVYFDNFIVRNYRSTEPAWGSWGEQEHNYPVPALSATDTFVAPSLGNVFVPALSSVDTAVAPAHLISILIPAISIQDTFVDPYYGRTELIGTIPTHDIFREVILNGVPSNKITKFPNTQGEHISLTFTSAEDDSGFELYYLREKMYKTTNLCNDQKHPNTQGSHIGVILKNSAAEEFILEYVSMEMYQT